ncbi:MAG: M42 family metallopeptidase [Candidatus Cloacimonadales bacterium]|nr:M42 family metallopeptidase [Candidatus Cloacimonadota bacterium]MDD2651068.1 M42 family metallopeptidase [Candidatus Cloacimonadota bacterium]MDD3502445.1 M42 family metallopeptidase [Candidatus Cloacimonadota bacterium]MDX9977947.1 M42 family metallopeptidase [Candidatus Cloacimonadales bacterium]
MICKEEYLEKCVQEVVKLCKIPSPTGYTQKACVYLMERLKEIGYLPYQSNKGSVIACLGGEGKPLVLAAHVDTLGAMVRSIKSNGAIRFTKIGGYPENNIENENCIVHTRCGKEYNGTFYLTTPSVHVYDNVATASRNDTTVELILDEKVKTKKDIEDLGIRVGDFISIDPRTVYTESGFIKSRHLDDKASAGILISLAEWVKTDSVKLNRKVYIVFTTYEEVGHGGASGIPDETVEMISVDMGALGDDLSCDEYQVSICAKDSGGPYNYELTSKLIEIAENNKIPHAIDIYPRYGSDVGATLSAGYDIKHGLVGPGVFASHGYERTHKEALYATLQLLSEYITY